jgi:1-acyl-sn-glycerol-3-phosphate acyltransferase
MRWLGGLPVDRARGSLAAKQVITAFRQSEELIVVIPPKGTSRKAEGWKRGFLLIARGAGVPIVCGYLDYRRKAGGFGPVIHPSGDVEADFEPMREFYREITPRHPASMSPLRLLDS